MNRFCPKKYQTKAWKHAAPLCGFAVGYRPEWGLYVESDVAGTGGRITQSLPRGAGDQGQVVGAIQITPIKPISSDKMVRVEVFPVCI